MVRKNKSRRRSYKRKYKKTLSKFNVYTNKSPAAQARQIYALKRRIKYVQKLCAPDVVQSVANGLKLFTNQSLGMASEYFQFLFIPGVQPFYNADTWSGNYPPVKADSTFNILGGYYRINCIYSNNYVGVADIGGCERHANVRVILLRRKTCFNTSPNNTNPASYLDGYETGGNPYLANHLLGFREGTAAECEVIYDKWKNINEQKPQCSFKIKIPRVLQTYMNNVTYPKNSLYGFVIVDGLSMGGTGYGTKVANVNCSCIARMCYSANSIDAT